ncbi:Conserved_hypothetical protein [Hexamita inflata]|uniref:Uncharacterized protein n=1 Tax=Hexamita inflata TaxID=28002 RepID=A0AA86PPX3_9EUKA|nr:Conserved hypothetical protein [Hexamita inflata]CAI9938854.1 Conserved hypothetical protein [Hexamita inflata]
MELSRTQKTQMYNCYDTKTDINLFADSGKIVVSIVSTKQQQCKIPHGVLMSLQIDSLGAYEPQIYLLDYDYNNTSEFTVLCDDPICSNLNTAKTALLIIETKTHITYVKVGSVRLANGLATNCFHDNESRVELLDGAIVTDFYPTYSCLNSIVIQQPGPLIMKTPDAAKVYIIYSDDSVSVHDPMTIDVLSANFIPTYAVTQSSATIRVKLSRAGISDHFIQSVQNGVITKAVKKIIINLLFTTDSILTKATQTAVNYCKFAGIQNAYSQMSMQLINGGFITRKVASPNMASYNTLLTSQQVTSYASEYVFTLNDVNRTSVFWFRIIGSGLPNYLLNVNPVHSTCSARYPNQKCELLSEKLKQFKLSELSVRANFYYYKGNALVNNYTVTIQKITDSCFSGGYLDVNGQELIVKIDENKESVFCELEENDEVQIVVMWGNNTVIKQFVLDYVPGDQKYTISNIIIEGTPEIRVKFVRDSEFVDAISLQTYVFHQTSNIKQQSVLTLIYILVTNLLITITYIAWIFLINPLIQKQAQQNSKIPKSFYEEKIDF